MNVNMETSYMGLKLPNPIVVSSSGLTNDSGKIKRLANAGAGAVVLKSLFEEQIESEINAQADLGAYTEAVDYVNAYVKANKVYDYLKLISQSKEKCDIPVIASVNCYSEGEWINFAKEIQAAGADALELNMFFLNVGQYADPGAYEATYINVLKKVKEVIDIPVALKIGRNFSDLVGLSQRLNHAGADGLVMFNRFYQPDIDINALELISGEVFSSQNDLGEVLRWISIVNAKNKNLDIAASTGVHEWEDVIKVLLSGAQVAQVCSTVYKHGNTIISEMLTCLEEWMVQKGYQSIADFQGLCGAQDENHMSYYERVQFMKYFSMRGEE